MVGRRLLEPVAAARLQLMIPLGAIPTRAAAVLSRTAPPLIRAAQARLGSIPGAHRLLRDRSSATRSRDTAPAAGHGPQARRPQAGSGQLRSDGRSQLV